MTGRRASSCRVPQSTPAERSGGGRWERSLAEHSGGGRWQSTPPAPAPSVLPRGALGAISASFSPRSKNLPPQLYPPASAASERCQRTLPAPPGPPAARSGGARWRRSLAALAGSSRWRRPAAALTGGRRGRAFAHHSLCHLLRPSGGDGGSEEASHRTGRLQWILRRRGHLPRFARDGGSSRPAIRCLVLQAAARQARRAAHYPGGASRRPATFLHELVLEPACSPLCALRAFTCPRGYLHTMVTPALSGDRAVARQGPYGIE